MFAISLVVTLFRLWLRHRSHERTAPPKKPLQTALFKERYASARLYKPAPHLTSGADQAREARTVSDALRIRAYAAVSFLEHALNAQDTGNPNEYLLLLWRSDFLEIYVTPEVIRIRPQGFPRFMVSSPYVDIEIPYERIIGIELLAEDIDFKVVRLKHIDPDENLRYIDLHLKDWDGFLGSIPKRKSKEISDRARCTPPATND